MPTTIAFMLLTILKYLAITESLIALILILESVLNIRFGLRTAYIQTLLWLFQVRTPFSRIILRLSGSVVLVVVFCPQYGKRRVDNKRLAIDMYQRPEKTWSRLQAGTDVLEDDTTARPLEVEPEEIEPSEYKLSSIFVLVRNGLRAIVDDEVTKAFDAEGM